MPDSFSPGLLVAAHGHGPAAHMAREWAARGRPVALVTDGPVKRTPNLVPIECDFRDAAAVGSAFNEARQHLGAVHEVVFSALPGPALRCIDLVQLPPADWASASHAAVKSVLYGLQAAARHLANPLSFTLVGPHLSLTGAAGMAPLCAALEAQRALAKAAARQWGHRGIRVNWVAISAPEFHAAFSEWPLPQVPELGPPSPALGRRIDIDSDVLPVIEFLGSPAAKAMTGLTINLDGGDWMLP